MENNRELEHLMLKATVETIYSGFQTVPQIQKEAWGTGALVYPAPVCTPISYNSLPWLLSEQLHLDLFNVSGFVKFCLENEFAA